MSQDKKLVVMTYIFLFVTFLSTGIFMEQVVQVNSFGTDVDSFNGAIPVEYVSLGAAYSAQPTKLKAIVKGSIYETGSNMTVFGACFDGDSYLFPAANATFTAWYPNGTLHTGPNATMFGITDDFQGNSPNGTGRHGISITMGDVLGTYLTEMRCEYQGEWAVAFGEWQNPEWVKRIGDTQDVVNNISSLLINVSDNLDVFINDTQNNFDNLQTSLNGTLSGNLENLDQDLIELRSAVQDIDLNMWVLDEKNPFYILSSGTHMWKAIDMLNENNVVVASSDGYIASWDSESWTEIFHTGMEWRGVSVFPANQPYSWIVGTDGASPYYSINGNNATLFTPPSGSPTALNDVKIFQRPNDPSGAFYGYLLGDTGDVYISINSGTNWSYAFAMGVNANASRGRISQVVENYDVFGQVDGYMTMFGQGSSVVLTDGTTQQFINVTGTVKDVSLLYYNLGYAVVEDASDTKVYKFNGTGTALDFTIDDPNVIPTGVVALARNDVWVTTTDPATFYHFDGRKWEYSSVGYSEFVSVVVCFGGCNSSSIGIQDVVMTDTKQGYAVGGDGLILIYGKRYDLLLQQINEVLAAQNGNLTIIQDALTTLNATMISEFNNLEATILQINTTVNYKLDNILNNVTFTQLWLNTTLYPLVVNIYDNTVDILTQIGVLQSQVNQTILLQNQTLNIVNETATDVDELLNRSRRIRAWVTQ